jgi:hypothetical protein
MYVLCGGEIWMEGPNGYSSMYYLSILGALQLKDKTKISVQELLGKFAQK